MRGRRLFAFLLLLAAAAAAKKATNKELTPAARAAAAAEDGVGWDAVTALHHQMDDDHSGSVDLKESTEFVREELNVQEKDSANWRKETFHTDNDEHITVDDLWTRWLRAKERNWTTEETLTWLSHAVELPQYADAFTRNAVDGRALPRLAVTNTSFLVHVLGITNPVHRQKIQLKAMDVVLFGYRLPGSGYVKDVVLIILLAFFISLYAMSRYQRASAQKQNRMLAEKMDKLRNMELHFSELQTQMETETEKKATLKDEFLRSESEKTEEIETLRLQLEAAERRLEKGVALTPLALQPLLRRTAERELANINQNKLDSMREMKEAMEMVEKLRRKGTGVVNSLRMAVSTDPATENLDITIIRIKTRMEKTAAMMEESLRRWREIESLCGFPVLGNRGLSVPVVRTSASSASLTPSVSASLPSGGVLGAARLVSLHGLESALSSALAVVPESWEARRCCLICTTAAPTLTTQSGPAYPRAFYEPCPGHSPQRLLRQNGASRVGLVPTAAHLAGARFDHPVAPHYPMDYNLAAVTQQGNASSSSANLAAAPSFHVGNSTLREEPATLLRHRLGEAGRADSGDSSSSNAPTEASLPSSKSKSSLFKPWKKSKA